MQAVVKLAEDLKIRVQANPGQKKMFTKRPAAQQKKYPMTYTPPQ